MNKGGRIVITRHRVICTKKRREHLTLIFLTTKFRKDVLFCNSTFKLREKKALHCTRTLIIMVYNNILWSNLYLRNFNNQKWVRVIRRERKKTFCLVTLNKRSRKEPCFPRSVEGAFVPSIFPLFVDVNDVTDPQLELVLAVWRVRCNTAEPIKTRNSH